MLFRSGGGNDVSASRPLLFERKDGEDLVNLNNNLRYIIQAVKSAGKTPILSRLSFRNYPQASSWKGWDQPPVNSGLNQESGSLPYNFTIDKIIKETTPMFWDSVERRGVVDFYPFTLNNQSWLISGDGVHFYGNTAFHVREFWADYALKYLYTGIKPTPLAYTEPVANLSVKATTAVVKAETSRLPKDVWDARILTEQIASRTVRIPLHIRLDNVEANNLAPAIIIQPANISTTTNSSVTFSVSVSGA